VYEPSIITHHPQKNLERAFFVVGKGSFEILSNFSRFVVAPFFDIMCLTIFPFEKPIVVFFRAKNDSKP
jgi:hypothetical protein